MRANYESARTIAALMVRGSSSAENLEEMPLQLAKKNPVDSPGFRCTAQPRGTTAVAWVPWYPLRTRMHRPTSRNLPCSCMSEPQVYDSTTVESLPTSLGFRHYCCTVQPRGTYLAAPSPAKWRPVAKVLLHLPTPRNYRCNMKPRIDPRLCTNLVIDYKISPGGA